MYRREVLFAFFLAAMSASSIAEEKIPRELFRRKFNKNIHENLATIDLKRVFGTDDPSKVPEYEVVHPHTVDQNAKRSPLARQRLHDEKPMFLHFEAFGLDFHLNITKNKNLVPSNQVIEHHNKDGVTRMQGRPSTFSTGKITTDAKSRVVLDHTSGLRGMISTSDDTFLIAPLPRHTVNDKDSSDSHGAHVMYRRSTPSSSQDSSCVVKRHAQDIQRPSQRQRRSTGTRKEKSMELLMAADKHMLAYYGREFLHSYLINQGNMIHSFFTDPSLEYPINVYVTRVVIFENDEFAGAQNMAVLLEKFGAWVSKNNPADDKDPLHADNSVLITRGGCANGCNLGGYANVKLCGSGHSIAKDAGLMTGLTIAHEIGHNLELDHDGNAGYEACQDGINIMATANTPDGRGFEWSKCSSDHITKNLESPASKCYDDKPTKHLSNHSMKLFGKVYSANKQCQLAFGKDYKHCTDYAYICKDLMCDKINSRICNPTQYSSAQGTWCGAHKWCIYGECVEDGTAPPAPKVIDGGWSSYSPYIKCNRPCGGGATWRTRTCTNPAPKNGGKACTGQTTTGRKGCNLHACPAGTKSFRQEQCEAISPEKQVVIDGARPCRLLCKSPGDVAFVYTSVTDGTSVSNSRDICIQGAIRKVGCDFKFESGTIADRCGVCGGDGSTCSRISGADKTHYSNDGEAHELFTIPKGAQQITVEELGRSGRYLGVKVGTSNTLAYYLPSWSKTVKVAGTDLRYTMGAYDYPDKIYIKGTINDKIRIFYVDYYYRPALGLKWTYLISAEGDTSSKEFLFQGSWGKCSKTCAGGTQTRSIQCRRTDDKSLISLSLCSSLPSKPAATQACNTQACPAIWKVHPWSSCSKSCGTGERTRTQTCSELRADQKYHVVADSVCKDAKPNLAVKEKCNVVACVAEWAVGAWSACSTTCGAGNRKRKVSCKRTKADGTVIVARTLECSAMLPAMPSEGKCNVDKLCSGWVIKFKPCTKKCGGGVQAPYVECSLSTRSCPLNQKPDVTKISPVSCNAHACPTYAWIASYGECVSKCGSGERTMILRCQDSYGKKVSSDICIQKKAAIPQPKKCTELMSCDVAEEATRSEALDYYRLGCYKDNIWSRRVPVFLKNLRNSIDWSNMAKTVKLCALEASTRSYLYFAIQFYGECWAGKETIDTEYYRDGPSKDCYDGTGSETVNYVYHLGKRTKLPPVLALGCYNGTFTDMVQDFKSDVDWTKSLDEKVTTKIVSKCAVAAANKGFSTFGLKYPAQCWSGPLALNTYNKGGPSNACSSNIGGTNAYYAYKVSMKTN